MPPFFTTVLRVSALLGLLLLAPARTRAQDEPFSRVEIGLRASSNVNRSFLHRFWTASGGYQGSVTMPFYAGHVELGGIYHEYTRIPGQRVLRSFTSVIVYLGWGYRLSFLRRLSLEGGVRLGNHRIILPSTVRATPGFRNENELTMGLYAALRARLWHGLALRFSADYMKTFTFVRIHLVHLSVGLSYTFRSPSWLATLLR